MTTNQKKAKYAKYANHAGCRNARMDACLLVANAEEFREEFVHELELMVHLAAAALDQLVVVSEMNLNTLDVFNRREWCSQ